MPLKTKLGGTQHTHHSTPFNKQSYAITLITDQVTGPANIGGIFRLADAFGVEEILFSSEIDLSSPRLSKTARKTEAVVSFQDNIDLQKELVRLKEAGYFLIGLEITSNSIAIQEVNISKEMPFKKIALVIGSEKHGISAEILSVLDVTAHIRMYGANSSMNVTQATAIALFTLTQNKELKK